MADTPLQEFKTLLPPQWPTRGNTDPDEWDRIKGKIGPEDVRAWVNIDLTCGRPMSETGSLRWCRSFGAPWEGSDNHEIEERTDVMMRDDDPEVLIEFFESDLQKTYFMGDEQDAKYLLIWSRAVYAALLYASRRDDKRWRRLVTLLRRWLGWMYHRLETHAIRRDESRAEWNRPPFREQPTVVPYIAALRTEYSPEYLFGFLLELHQGKHVNTNSLLMRGPGNYTASGFPRGVGVWFGLECRRLGLLKGIKPIPCKVKWPEHGDIKSVDHVESYLVKLEWWPSGSPTLVRTKKVNGKPVETAVVSKKGPADLREPPGRFWG